MAELGGAVLLHVVDCRGGVVCAGRQRPLQALARGLIALFI
jgi:hypothetical protein